MPKEGPSLTGAEREAKREARRQVEAAAREQEAAVKKAAYAALQMERSLEKSGPTTHLSKKEARAAKKREKEELKRASQAALGSLSGCKPSSVPPQTVSLAGVAVAHGGLAGASADSSLHDDNPNAPSITLNHSTHTDGLIRVLRKLVTLYNGNGNLRWTPGRLSTLDHSNAPELTLRVQRGKTVNEDGRACSYKAVARNGRQCQDVFIVVDPVLIQDQDSLQGLIDDAMEMRFGGHDAWHLDDGYSKVGAEDPLSGGPLNLNAEEKKAIVKEQRAREKKMFQQKQARAAEQRQQTVTQKQEKKLRAVLGGADRKGLKARAELNAGLTSGSIPRGKGGFGGRSKQIESSTQ